MYDPVTQLMWDAGKQWFGRTRGQILNDPDYRAEFIEMIKGFKGYNKLIDKKADDLIKSLGD